MTKIRLGTSGWSYDEWIKVFYPKKDTRKLSYYSNIFETSEINSTFYANPKPMTVIGWIRQTPQDFKFAIKIPQLITHKKRLSINDDVEEDLNHFLDLIRPIIHSDKIGPILIQLPPSFTNKQYPQLQEFLSILPNKPRFAVEFRNKSWINTETWRLLEQFDVANTITDSPLLPKNPVITTDFAFIRWHGRNKKLWYDYQYSKKELKPWQLKLQKIMGNVKEVFGYFNNHPGGYAVRNLLDMNELLGRLTPRQVEIRQKVVGVLDGVDGQQKLF